MARGGAHKSRAVEPPLDVFGAIRCPGCGSILRVVRSRALKRRREVHVTLYCVKCRARYRLRLERF